MPPLVVVRAGGKRVEYQENCSSWRRAASSSDSDSDADSADDAEVEGQLRAAEASRERAASVEASTRLREVEGSRALRCADCGVVVADRHDVISKTFYGRTGKACLMHSMLNVSIGPARNRYLMTGMHTIADVSCQRCGAVLGWKYFKAMELSQKYKEGRFIMENALVEDDWEEEAWGRR